MTKPTYYDCGICDMYHRANWDGDCRDDAERFNPEQLDATFGGAGWEEIEMEAVDEWRAMQAQLPND